MTRAIEQKDLQLILTSEEPEKVRFGLNMALVAASSTVEVVVFFALKSARFVCAKHGDDRKILDLIATLRELGVELLCCSACAHEHCGVDSQSSPLVEGVRDAGLASVVQRASKDFTTITI